MSISPDYELFYRQFDVIGQFSPYTEISLLALAKWNPHCLPFFLKSPNNFYELEGIYHSRNYANIYKGYKAQDTVYALRIFKNIIEDAKLEQVQLSN